MILKAVYFRGTETFQKYQGEVYYTDRTRMIVNFLGIIMQILAWFQIEQSGFLRRGYPRSAFREFLYVCEYKLRAL